MRALCLFIAVSVLAGCEPAPAPIATAPQVTVPASPKPLTIPVPVLSGVDEHVKMELAEAHRQWQAAVTANSDMPQQAELAGRLGMLALAYEQNALADQALAWARQAQPGDYRWCYLQAESARAAGDLDAARADLREALHLAPDYAPARWQLAEMLLQVQQYDQARDLLGPVASDEPAALLGLRGRLALARKDFAEAARSLRAALKLEPGASRLQYPLGLALRGLGQEQAAREALGRRGDGSPAINDPLMDEVRELASGARVLVVRAGQAALSGDYPAAILLYREALVQADEPQTRLNLAISLARAGQPAEAEIEYRKVIAADPSRAEAFFALGTLLASQGKDAQAIPAYQQAVNLHPQDVDAHFNMANALRRLEHYREAEQAYAKVLDLDPARSEATLGRALMLNQLEHWQLAERVLRAGLQASPLDARLALELARLLACAPDASVRDGSAALVVAERLFARESNIDNGAVLAAALAETGRFDEAARLQGELIAAAQSYQRPDLVDALKSGLALYSAAKPYRLGQRQPARTP